MDLRRFAVFLILITLSACAQQLSEPVTEIIRFYVTATPRSTSTPSLTPSPTLEPTATHTPTPTAVPAVIAGNPRVYQRLDPTPAYGAPCGFVDTFDFPLDPPDGENASGGFGFGVFNSRYGKFHAGEDWGYQRQNNLGKPVFSIGHGQVTYAAPSGWGLDKGTIVIRHVFPWGGYLLSFYGHLAPASVQVRTGECVERGDKIGEIGNPRTPPHLHFETRLHLPSSTGHGYWSVNPSLAGWLPPSQTILETRMRASPGVLWVMPYQEGITINLGTHDDTALILHGEELLGISPQDGEIRWRQTVSDTTRKGVLDEDVPQVYLLDLFGDLSAYPLPGPSDPDWKIKLNTYSSAELIPLPGGGLLAADRRRAILVDPDGQVLWEADIPGKPVSWLKNQDSLVFMTSDLEKSIWTAKKGGIESWELKLDGVLRGRGTDIYLYTDDGIYQLDIGNQNASLLLELPSSIPKMRDLLLLDNGSIVIIHVDGNDRRLIALNPDGAQEWERSIKDIPMGDWELVNQSGKQYLFVSSASSAMTEIGTYEINIETGELTYLFRGGNRQSYTRGVWMSAMGDGLWMINIGGGPLVGLDLQVAAEIMN